MKLRRHVLVVTGTLAITSVTVIAGLVTNTASSQESWPGLLEPMRLYPWQALFILSALTALFGVLATRLPTLPEPPEPAEGSEVDQLLVSSGMLPPDAPNFTGREEELRTLATAMRTGGDRVLVVDGMAGVGKTALVIRAGRLLASQFPDGLLFIDLHAYTAGHPAVDPADALARLLSAVGVPAENIPTGSDVAAVVEERAALWRSRLTGRRILVVLDNAAGSEQVMPLLPGSAGCLLLVTSRRRLAALAAPRVELDVLPELDAAELFVRAADREVEAGQQAALAELMRLCGFLPLAITLLAGRLRQHTAWSITDVVQRMCQSRDRLSDLRAEHLAVASAFDLSYQALSAEQQLFFGHLSLHPGPEIDAFAAAALNGIPVAHARTLLDDLHDGHLLIERVTGRFRMHNLIAEYARSPTVAIHEIEGNRSVARLLDFYQHATVRAARHLQLQPRVGPEPEVPCAAEASEPALDNRAEAIAWLDAERDNVLGCITYAGKHAQPARVVALIGALACYLRLSGPWDQSVRLHGTAISYSKHLGDQLGEANALYDLGVVQRLTGDYPSAIDSLRQALALYRVLGHRIGEANALHCLGIAQYLTGGLPVAADNLRQSLALYRDHRHRLGQAYALAQLGIVHRITAEYPVATVYLKRALRLHLDLGGRLDGANSLNYLTDQHSARSIPPAANDHQQPRTPARGLGDRLGEAYALTQLGIVQYSTNDFLAASSSLWQALVLFRDLGHRLGEATAFNHLGTNQRLTGDYSAAADSLRQALTLFRDLGDRYGQAEALENLGTLELALADQVPERMIGHRRLPHLWRWTIFRGGRRDWMT
ncbi:ATP-binding protein [Salinispora arenicola]|uniref:ATP-binding protein n=1 Tax=Salinispora arenicola TaxID=168697 RepID=UPI0012BC4EF0|nr:tetratricopeptide repeat protein [Salinispora arenicola]